MLLQVTQAAAAAMFWLGHGVVGVVWEGGGGGQLELSHLGRTQKHL